MATGAKGTTDPGMDVVSLATILDTEEIVGAEASFELTDELRSAVERGAKATAENPGGWLRVTIPASVSKSDGSVWTPTDDECKTILSERENNLRAASAQMGYSFRRQTPKANGKESLPRVMLFRINKKETKKSE